MRDLGTLGGPEIRAYGINNSGQVVGYSWTTSTASAHAFLYSGGTMQNLGVLGGCTTSCGYGINDSGQVVGNSSDNAFLWQSGKGMQNLGTLPGQTGCYAYAINNSGQVVGDSGAHAFLWQSGTGMRDIGTLGGSDSEAEDINASGQIVGTSWPAGGTTWHAFLYSGGTMQDLGLGDAHGINDNGQVVGDNGYAFLWQSDIGMQNLNDLISSTDDWILDSATGINDKGQICGFGINPSGQTDAFLLTPTPEPSTFVLLVVGGFSLVAYAWRRRRRAA